MLSSNWLSLCLAAPASAAEMIRGLEAHRAALGLRAVGSSEQTPDLLGEIGLHASMAEGKQNSNYVFKPTPDLALGSNRACGRRGLTRR